MLSQVHNSSPLLRCTTVCFHCLSKCSLLRHQFESQSSWNADTGASAHMTFNRHWMRHMTPHHIPIRLADGSVVYSEGIGSVRFIPAIEGQEMCPLEFTNVLYVPSLSTNLFSVLYLSMYRHFTVTIELCYYPSVQCQSFASEARAIVG